MTNRNWLPASVALKNLKAFLTEYLIPSNDPKAHDDVLDTLEVLCVGLQTVADAQPDLANLRTHSVAVLRAAANREIETAQSERTAALAACSSLERIIDRSPE